MTKLSLLDLYINDYENTVNTTLLTSDYTDNTDNENERRKGLKWLKIKVRVTLSLSSGNLKGFFILYAKSKNIQVRWVVTPNSHQTFMAFRWDLENVKTFGRLQTDKATKKEDVSWNVLDFTKKLFSSFSSYKLKTAMYAVLAQLASSTSPVRMRSLVRIQTYGLYQIGLVEVFLAFL